MPVKLNTSSTSTLSIRKSKLQDIMHCRFNKAIEPNIVENTLFNIQEFLCRGSDQDTLREIISDIQNVATMAELGARHSKTPNFQAEKSLTMFRALLEHVNMQDLNRFVVNIIKSENDTFVIKFIIHGAYGVTPLFETPISDLVSFLDYAKNTVSLTSKIRCYISESVSDQTVTEYCRIVNDASYKITRGYRNTVDNHVSESFHKSHQFDRRKNSQDMEQICQDVGRSHEWDNCNNGTYKEEMERAIENIKSGNASIKEQVVAYFASQTPHATTSAVTSLPFVEHGIQATLRNSDRNRINATFENEHFRLVTQEALLLLNEEPMKKSKISTYADFKIKIAEHGITIHLEEFEAFSGDMIYI